MQTIGESATQETSPKCRETLGASGRRLLTPPLLCGLSPDSGCWAHGRDCLAGCGSPGRNFTGRLIVVGRFLTWVTVSALIAHRGHASISLSSVHSKNWRTSHTFNLIILMFSDPILSLCEGEPDMVFLSTALSGVLINIKKFERITRRSEQNVKVYFAKTAGNLLVSLYIFS